ncbi:MAG: PAS domain-containing protein [Desertifilum sp. SIO1I2]|nr:PAS domain-containing protein [Desertifilum sp. SIO1I2]
MDSPSRTVLIVDGVPASREQYRLLLLRNRQYSYTILEAFSGMQGLDLWQQHQPDAILLGYPLPDLADQVFLAQLQRLTQQSSLPVIPIVDQSSEELAAQAIAAGAQTYLLKDQLNAQTLRIAIDLTITNCRLQQQLQQSQAALQESKEQLKSTLNAVRTGLWEWNIQTGLIQWSDNLEPLFGLQPGEFDGSFQMFVEQLHPDDRDRVLTAIDRAVATGGDYEIEFRVLYPNGRIRWALSQGKVFYNEDRQPLRMVGNDIDITERKQVEAALRQSEQRYAALAKISPVGIFRTDAQGDCLYTNDRWCELAGLTPIEAKEKGWLDALHPEDRDRVCAEWYRAAELNLPFRSEYRFQTSQGIVSWLIGQAIPERDSDGNLIGYVGTVTDITGRKQVEQALQESEKQFRQLTENIDAVFWIRDTLTQYIRYVSPAYERLWGLDPRELYEDPQVWVNYIHPDDRASTEQAFWEKAPSGQFDQEYRIVLPNGHVRWVSDRCFPLYSETGEIYRFTGIAEDITDRKQFEEQLRQNEERFRASVETMLDCFAVYRSVRNQQGEIVDFQAEYINDAACHTSQIPKEQHLSRGLCELLPGHRDSGLFAEYCQVVETGQPLVKDSLIYEYEFGQQRLAKAFDIRIAKFGDGYIATWRDITDRKQVEAEAEAGRHILDALMEYVPEGITIADAPNVAIRRVSRYGQQLTGRSPDVLESIPAEEHADKWGIFYADGITPATGDVLPLTRAVQQGEIITDEEWVLRQPDGTKVTISCNAGPIYANGEITGGVIAWRDITARKQTEIDLQERNQHIQLLYETTRDLLSTNQPLTLIQSVFEDLKALVGLDIYFNYMLDKQQQKLHLTSYDGISTEQAEEIAWLDVGVAIRGTAVEQRSQIMQAHIQQCTDPKSELVRSLGLTAYCAQPLIAQDKLYGTLSFGSRSRLEFTPSEQNLFQAICDQIAIALERSELFHSLQQQTEELIRANRVKDEFLAVLSHELRSPLNPILGWAKLLQTRKFDRARTADALATIERNARLQTQLIDDLLDIARILRGKLSLEMATVDLVFVIESAIDTVRAAAVAKNIYLHSVLLQTGRISGDATRLQQIMWNLLSNAIKFTPNHGQVEVRLECVENQAQITVSDTGKGINPDFLPHLFESFRQEDATTTRQYGGLGLGLSIVRHLVEAHGGTIRADSLGEGHGATFTVQLPLLEPEPDDRNRPEKSLEQELDLTGVRVLAVDDEPDARELLSVLLAQYGAEVLTVSSAAEVLANLEFFQPDILISDIGMPNMDGFALIQLIRALPSEKGGQIPAIALTAYARQEDYQQAISNGYQHHVTKPLNPEQLVRVVMALMD